MNGNRDKDLSITSRGVERGKEIILWVENPFMTTHRAIVRRVEEALIERIGSQSVSVFHNVVQRYEIDRESLLVLRETHEVSIPYVGKLMQRGHSFVCIEYAYELRDELGALYNTNSSHGTILSEFYLSVENGAKLLELFFPDQEIDTECVCILAESLRDVAEEFRQILSWSGLAKAIVEASTDSSESPFLCERGSQDITDAILEILARTDLAQDDKRPEPRSFTELENDDWRDI